MVPFADCLNHTNVQTKYDFNVESIAVQQGESSIQQGMFRLYPTGDNQYLKGSEVFNSYGRRDNRFLLMEYGFALHANEWDTITISMNLTEEHHDNPKKLALLTRFNVSTRRSFRLRFGRLNQDFMSMCRLSAMSEHDMDDRRNELRFWSEGVSIENELQAQRVYIERLEETLRLYPTTLEQDVALLQQAPDDQRMVAATRYRHTKKRILHNHIHLLRQGLQPIMELLLTQEQSNFKNSNPKGLQLNYLQKYLETIMLVSLRGPEDKQGRLTEAELQRQQEEEDDEDREEREEQALLEVGGDGLEHKSGELGEVIVTHPNGSGASDELLRLKKELAQALCESRGSGGGQTAAPLGRSVQSGTPQ